MTERSSRHHRGWGGPGLQHGRSPRRETAVPWACGRPQAMDAIRRRGGRAPLVIGGRGARATFNHLLLCARCPQSAALPGPLGKCPRDGRISGCGRTRAGSGSRGERLDLQRPARTIGADGAVALAGRARSGYLSFPSLKDPAATRHTAEVIRRCRVRVRSTGGARTAEARQTGVAVKERVGRGLVGPVTGGGRGFAATGRLRRGRTP